MKKSNRFGFCNISLKKAVAVRFRSFSRKVSKSHTETLTAMMDFFEWHGISPKSKFGMSEQNEHAKTRKRVEANIAILRDIEQTQTKPLSIQMDLLFEGQTRQRERPKRVERLFADGTASMDPPENDATMVPREQLESAERRFADLRKDMAYLLDRIKLVRPALGKEQLRLEMSPVRFEALKAGFENKKE